MKLSQFNYNLPKELIAQHPSEKRDESRLLVLHRDTGKIEHRIFKDIVDYFHKDDLVVLNNTKVVPARLWGRKETGGKVEALVLQGPRTSRFAPVRGRQEYEVLLKPARGCEVGSKLIFGDGELKAEVDRIENGRRFLKFECNGNFDELLDRFGKMPLPPYIKRDAEDADKDRYQTVYASKKGAIAAPTAGLHFTNDILSRITDKGIDIQHVTLHVGYGTFKPVKCDDVSRHEMEKEYFEIKPEVIKKLQRKKGRTIAVGTTTCRVLETIAKKAEAGPRLFLKPRSSLGFFGWTELFIHSPYRFKAVDALLTNFHLPRTTLLMLVSAFCSRELLFKAYKEAVDKKYRFYSYGDAMLIL
ncbi:MAG: tRNA preQ1(34) S-adenosylmethionine ribosyltransferase-isomerase QueA [Candidatus Gorgyraea atricola]|nr:tRNA preQ1(34) S-adenosylmethionine ribosyltransferase-isomerase QueA [Candidatus Gorgyraea atricola]